MKTLFIVYGWAWLLIAIGFARGATCGSLASILQVALLLGLRTRLR